MQETEPREVQVVTEEGTTEPQEAPTGTEEGTKKATKKEKTIDGFMIRDHVLVYEGPQNKDMLGVKLSVVARDDSLGSGVIIATTSTHFVVGPEEGEFDSENVFFCKYAKKTEKGIKQERNVARVSIFKEWPVCASEAEVKKELALKDPNTDVTMFPTNLMFKEKQIFVPICDVATLEKIASKRKAAELKKSTIKRKVVDPTDERIGSAVDIMREETDIKDRHEEASNVMAKYFVEKGEKTEKVAYAESFLMFVDASGRAIEFYGEKDFSDPKNVEHLPSSLTSSLSREEALNLISSALAFGRHLGLVDIDEIEKKDGTVKDV